MFLGIEIGGTKLQLGVSAGRAAELVTLRRLQVVPDRGAAGIRDQIAAAAGDLLREYDVQRIGIGFGGPVDRRTGVTLTSHQIAGWDHFPLRAWCEETLKRPTRIGNDCDVAALAEARFGAGRGRRVVFYVTVGTGVGGGCVIDGRLLGAGRPAVAEIGHLRPGVLADSPDMTLESLASGWGIAAAVRRRLDASASPADTSPDLADLRRACRDDPGTLTAVDVADAARRGNRTAFAAIEDAVRVLGWGVAQTLTLLAPDVVVVGGGVAQLGEDLFFAPLRKFVAQYVFPPLRGAYEVVPAALGEAVVVHGAVALAVDPSTGGV